MSKFCQKREQGLIRFSYIKGTFLPSFRGCGNGMCPLSILPLLKSTTFLCNMKCTFQFPVCNVMMYLLYCKYYFVSYSCTCPNSWRGCCLCQSGEHNKSDLYHQLILCTTSRYYLVPWIKGNIILAAKFK